MSSVSGLLADVVQWLRTGAQAPGRGEERVLSAHGAEAGVTSAVIQRVSVNAIGATGRL